MTPPDHPPAASSDPSDRTEERLSWLFRRSLREQRLHPLHALLRRHRGLGEGPPPAWAGHGKADHG